MSDITILNVKKDKLNYPVGLKFADPSYKFNNFDKITVAGVEGYGFIITANKRCSDPDNIFNMRSAVALNNHIGFVIVSNPNEKC